MYNIKVFKYPSGWQYRIYSQPVGFKDDGVPDCKDPELWYNPFEDVYERGAPEFVGEFDEILIDEEKRKERSIKNSMNRTINNIYHLARSNMWDWFITLTFDPQKVDSLNYDMCVKCLSKWLNNLKRISPELKYIIVPEKHKSGRYHFHGLFADCWDISFIDSGKKTSDGQTIFNIGNYKLGWSTATQITDNQRVTKYISKYISKDLVSVTVNKKRYWASRNLELCEEEEILIDGRYLDNYVSKLLMYSKHHKFRHGADLTTLYIETDAPM